MLPAIVLSGGASSRMGRPKALLPIKLSSDVTSSDVFVTRVIRTLKDAAADDVVLVAGSDADAIAAFMERAMPDVRVAVNPQPSDGQLSSLLVGLSVVDRPGVRGAIVALVDHPRVRVETVRELMSTYERTHAAIVRPARHGRHGHPVIFDRRTFDALRHAHPSLGAKEVIRAYAGELVDVEIDDEGAFEDIDTPEDYERAFGVPLITHR